MRFLARRAGRRWVGAFVAHAPDAPTSAATAIWTRGCRRTSVSSTSPSPLPSALPESGGGRDFDEMGGLSLERRGDLDDHGRAGVAAGMGRRIGGEEGSDLLEGEGG